MNFYNRVRTLHEAGRLTGDGHPAALCRHADPIIRHFAERFGDWSTGIGRGIPLVQFIGRELVIAAMRYMVDTEDRVSLVFLVSAQRETDRSLYQLIWFLFPRNVPASQRT